MEISNTSFRNHTFKPNLDTWWLVEKREKFENPLPRFDLITERINLTVVENKGT